MKNGKQKLAEAPAFGRKALAKDKAKPADKNVGPKTPAEREKHDAGWNDRDHFPGAKTEGRC